MSLKPIEIGYGDDKYIFTLRMISVAEQDEFDLRFADISDSDPAKWQKEFDLCKKALGEFSADNPKKLFKVKGELKQVDLNDKETPFAQIDEHFKERTPQNERVIRLAYQMFKAQLTPTASFL